MASESENARADALEALDDAQLKKLEKVSRLLAVATMEPCELLQAAFLRWLGSKSAIENSETTYRFLVGAMKSIRSNTLRHDDVVRRTVGERIQSTEEGGDGTELLTATEAVAEDRQYAQQVFDLFADDPEIQEYILMLVDGAKRAEIQAELGWDDRKYQAVQKRRTRAIAKFISEGKV